MVLNHGRWPHGMDWLSEVAAECYVPLLDVFNRLVDEGISPKVTLGLTPVLVEQLADGMGDAWRADLAGDGVDGARVDELVDASHAKITGAPALVLGCLTWDGLDRYPDETRQRAEFGMALLSLGAAVENLMVAAADAGYASCWVAAPIFCPEAARDALDVPDEWLPHALVLVGRPDPVYVGRPRPPVPLGDLRAFR